MGEKLASRIEGVSPADLDFTALDLLLGFVGILYSIKLILLYSGYI